MRVIPVIDLLQGQVVRGIAGRRSEYRPIVSQIVGNAEPASVARAFVEEFGFETAYVADLDAIVHGRYAAGAWRDIGAAGLKVWLDAGVRDRESAEAVGRLAEEAGCRADVVVGLESLVAEEELAEIVRLTDNRAIFSLDLKDGRLLTSMGDWQSRLPLDIAERVAVAGIRRLIVLDLADVGGGGGTRTLRLCQEIRRAHPEIELIAGGGVRGSGDLRALADAGCDAALVASALHDGRLKRVDLG